MTKNISNWFQSTHIRNVPVIGSIAGSLNPYTTTFTAFLVARFIWISWHWFAWQGLTVFSFVIGISYGIIFYIPYFLSDYIGILTPDQRLKWKNPMTIGAITCHGMWDSLVTIGGLGLGFTSDMLLGGILVVVPLIAMFLIRNYKAPKVKKH